MIQCQADSRPFEGCELPCILCTCDHLTLLCQMASALITASSLLPFQLGISSDVHTHTGRVHLHLRLHRGLSLLNASSHSKHQHKCEFISRILKISLISLHRLSKQQLVEGSYTISRDRIQQIFVDWFTSHLLLCKVSESKYCSRVHDLESFNDSGQSQCVGFVIRLFYLAVPYIYCHFYTTLKHKVCFLHDATDPTNYRFL